MSIVYLTAAVIDLLLFIPLYRAVKLHSRFWRVRSEGVQMLWVGLAAAVLLFAIVCWAFMVLTTADSWIVSLDPSRPKPYFLVTWFLGLSAYGIAWLPLSPLLRRLAVEPRST